MDNTSSTNCSHTPHKTSNSAIILGTRIDAVTWDETISKISDWSQRKESRYICICNVHSVVTASLDARFASTLQHADMATPDGAPVAWAMRRIGFRGQKRINGPDLMLKYCAHAEKNGEKIFLYGGKQNTLDILQVKLNKLFPDLIIAGHYSPPFRDLTDEEDAQIVNKINASGAGTLWVSLGCPKQEIWMENHKHRIKAVMIGVGAAFDYHAGTISRAPNWMQRLGLEWFHRLSAEPKRLWKRYLITNSIFITRIPKSIIEQRLKKNSICSINSTNPDNNSSGKFHSCDISVRQD